MKWSLKANEKVGKGDQTRGEWVEQLKADGHDTTGMLEDEPELFDDLVPYWNAFHVLSSSRSSGMSIGAIPLPAYESYFRIFRIDSLEERLEYIHYVSILDGEFLKWQGEKSEKDRKKKEAKSKSQPAVPPRAKPKRR